MLNSDLYQLDLCENTLTFLTTLDVFGNSKLLINQKVELLSRVAGGGLTLYNIISQEFATENIVTTTNIQRYAWADNSNIWVSHFVYPNSTIAKQRWVLFDLNDNALDTLDFSSGEVSEPRNGKSVFKTFNVNGLALNLYQYDLNQEIAIDSMPPPENFGLPSLGTPQWINDNEVLVHNLRTIAIADFTTQSYQVVKAFPEECYNYEISSVQPVPNRPNEILYVLDQYFYNEDGEYRKRHDLIHLNIETGEESILLID